MEIKVYHSRCVIVTSCHHISKIMRSKPDKNSTIYLINVFAPYGRTKNIHAYELLSLTMLNIRSYQQ